MSCCSSFKIGIILDINDLMMEDGTKVIKLSLVSVDYNYIGSFDIHQDSKLVNQLIDAIYCYDDVIGEKIIISVKKGKSGVLAIENIIPYEPEEYCLYIDDDEYLDLDDLDLHGLGNVGYSDNEGMNFYYM